MNSSERASNWVDEYGDLLFRFALHKTGSREVAEDLVQETLLSAFKSLDTFKGEASDKTWLMRILRNKVIDYYRKSRTKSTDDEASHKKEVSLDTHFDESGAWTLEPESYHWDDQPDHVVENAQLSDALENCIDGLKGKGAEAFRLKYIEDVDSDEICKVLDITSSNYWVLIHRAKLQLRDCLDAKYYREVQSN